MKDFRMRKDNVHYFQIENRGSVPCLESVALLCLWSSAKTSPDMAAIKLLLRLSPYELDLYSACNDNQQLVYYTDLSVCVDYLYIHYK